MRESSAIRDFRSGVVRPLELQPPCGPVMPRTGNAIGFRQITGTAASTSCRAHLHLDLGSSRCLTASGEEQPRPRGAPGRLFVGSRCRPSIRSSRRCHRLAAPRAGEDSRRRRPGPSARGGAQSLPLRACGRPWRIYRRGLPRSLLIHFSIPSTKLFSPLLEKL